MVTLSKHQLFISSEPEGTHFRTARHQALIQEHFDRRKSNASDLPYEPSNSMSPLKQTRTPLCENNIVANVSQTAHKQTRSITMQFESPYFETSSVQLQKLHSSPPQTLKSEQCPLSPPVRRS